MPYALVQGPAPAISCLPGMPLPAEVGEADFVDALAGELAGADILTPVQARTVLPGRAESALTPSDGSATISAVETKIAGRDNGAH